MTNSSPSGDSSINANRAAIVIVENLDNNSSSRPDDSLRESWLSSWWRWWNERAINSRLNQFDVEERRTFVDQRFARVLEAYLDECTRFELSGLMLTEKTKQLLLQERDPRIEAMLHKYGHKMTEWISIYATYVDLQRNRKNIKKSPLVMKTSKLAKIPALELALKSNVEELLVANAIEDPLMGWFHGRHDFSAAMLARMQNLAASISQQVAWSLLIDPGRPRTDLSRFYAEFDVLENFLDMVELSSEECEQRAFDANCLFKVRNRKLVCVDWSRVRLTTAPVVPIDFNEKLNEERAVVSENEERNGRQNPPLINFAEKNNRGHVRWSDDEECVEVVDVNASRALMHLDSSGGADEDCIFVDSPGGEYYEEDENDDFNCPQLGLYDAVESLNIDAPNDFINASRVLGGPLLNTFILTQVPLKHTIGDFWRMVWQERSEYVFMLCEASTDPVDCSVISSGSTFLGAKHCPFFWPRIEGDELNFGSLHVRNAGIDMATDPLFTVINLDVWMVWGKEPQQKQQGVAEKNVGPSVAAEQQNSSINSNQSNSYRTSAKIRLQLWQWDWRNYTDFHWPFRLLLRSRHSKRPTILMCSDGCGRAGTLALIEIFLMQLLRGAVSFEHPMLTAAVFLRLQRRHAVANPMQWLFAYRTVLHWLQPFVISWYHRLVLGFAFPSHGFCAKYAEIAQDYAHRKNLNI